MNCAILYRVGNGRLEYVYDDDDEGNGENIAEFPSMDAALAYCDRNKLFQSGQAHYQIVELDDL